MQTGEQSIVYLLSFKTQREFLLISRIKILENCYGCCRLSKMCLIQAAFRLSAYGWTYKIYAKYVKDDQ